jgi:hypothetical protein
LAVAGQHLLAGVADSGPVALQAAKDGEYVVLAVLVKEFFAVANHVGMTGCALLIGALAQAVLYGRWLCRQLRERSWSNGQHQSDRQDAFTEHTWLSPQGITPGITAQKLSHTFLPKVRLRLFAPVSFFAAETKLLHAQISC